MKNSTTTILKRIMMWAITLTLALPASAGDFEYTYEGQTLTYTVIDEDAKTVETKAGNYPKPGNNVSGELIIPETVFDGDIKYTVTSFGNSAFEGCSSLTSVTIPNSVTDVFIRAFAGCSGLTSVTIPNSVTLIGTYAFVDCSGLTSVTIPNSVTEVWYGAFSGCTGLTSVVIPNSVTELGNDVFKGCTNLIKSAYPDNLANPFPSGISISYNAKTAMFEDGFIFEHGSALLFAPISFTGEYSVPNTITSIGYGAFSGCTGLTSVVIPNSVTKLGNDVFKGCTNLIKSAYPDNLKNPFPSGISIPYNARTAVFEDGCIYKPGSTFLFAPISLTGEYSVPNTIESIGDNAFYGCKAMTSVSIPNSVTSIGNNAFDSCGLTSVEIPNSITSIGDGVFKGCTCLTSVVIPNSVTSIGSSAFNGCSGLTLLTIGNSVTSIGAHAFESCSGLTSVTIPNSVTSIGNSAFWRCSGLTSVTIPGSVTSIGDNAFAYTGLKEVRTGIYSLPDNIGLKNEIPGWTNDIMITLLPDGNNGFAGISSNNLQYFKKIRACKDSKMYGLVKASDKLNFSNAGYQENDIALVALDQRSQVRSSDNPSVVLFDGKDITDAVLSDAGYEFRPSLLHEENIFTVYGGSTGDRITMDIVLQSPGTLFNEVGQTNIDKVEVLSIKGNINGTDVMTINKMPALRILDISGANIVEGGTTYREDLKTKTDVVGTQFFYNTSLVSVKLPASAKEIADDAFANLKTLRELRLGTHISKIGKGAFSGCQKLQNLNIPGSVTSIGANAFTDCASLSSLNLEDGKSDLTLADLSFQASPLKEVYWGRKLKYNSAKKPFEGCVSLSSVTLGDNITALLESEFKGCVNLKTVNGGTNVKTIGKEAFMNCYSLEKFTIPTQLTTIEASVFNGCVSLADIYLSDNITSIGNLAFRGTALTEIRIPERVRFIGESAFSGCAKLKSVYSYNLTPPEISSTTFDSQTEMTAELKVIGEAEVYYWLDPVWQEFGKMSGNLLYMKEIPDMTYGDPEFDLSQYGSGDAEVAYMTTTPDLISVEGSTARISGAGDAEIWIIPADPESEKESYVRKFNIAKRVLKFKKKDLLLFEGQEFRFSEPVYSAGLAYDDKIEDIEKLPEFTCAGGAYPEAGIYDIAISGGTDKNYVFEAPMSILVVAGPESTVDFRRTSPFYTHTSENAEVEGILSVTLDQATLDNQQQSTDPSAIDIHVTFNCGDDKQESVLTFKTGWMWMLSPMEWKCSWTVKEKIPSNGKVDCKIIAYPDSYCEREYEFGCSVWAFADSDLFPNHNVLVESVEVYSHCYSVRNKCMREYLHDKYPITGDSGNIIPVCFYFNNPWDSEFKQVPFMEDDNSAYYYSVLNFSAHPYFYFDRKPYNSADFTEIVDYLKSRTTKRSFFSTGIEAIRQDDSENGIVNIEFSVTPAASVNEVPVNVALILTQDNIHGLSMANSRPEIIINNCNIPEDMKPYAEWYVANKGIIIPPVLVEYNDVVRFILPAEETLASDWTAKVPVKGTFSFRLPDNPVAYMGGTMDPENLNFIIVATDAVSGECAASNILNWGKYLENNNGSCKLQLSLDKEDLSLSEGQSEILTPIIVKEDDVEIESENWFTSDSSVATVENGVVTAIAKGEATIGYKLTDSFGHEHIATCRLTVGENVGLDSVNQEESNDILIFTADGLRLNSTLKDLAPGIYIIRRGNEVRKIKVK